MAMEDMLPPQLRRCDYTQVKVSIDPVLANAFKEACRASGVSMASVLSDYMADFSRVDKKHKQGSLTTRRQRKTAIKRFSEQLCMIRDAEEAYLGNVPENFQGSVVTERAENFISLLEDVLEILDSVE
jgi:hypothetical protein